MIDHWKAWIFSRWSNWWRDKEYFLSSIRYIDDKKVLPTCASDKFEKITDDIDFELWHFVLENEDIDKNYGVYINNGILSESCSEAAFNISWIWMNQKFLFNVRPKLKLWTDIDAIEDIRQEE